MNSDTSKHLFCETSVTFNICSNCREGPGFCQGPIVLHDGGAPREAVAAPLFPSTQHAWAATRPYRGVTACTCEYDAQYARPLADCRHAGRKSLPCTSLYHCMFCPTG